MTIFLYLARRLDEFKTFLLQYSITVSLRRSYSVNETGCGICKSGLQPSVMNYLERNRDVPIGYTNNDKLT